MYDDDETAQNERCTKRPTASRRKNEPTKNSTDVERYFVLVVRDDANRPSVTHHEKRITTIFEICPTLGNPVSMDVDSPLVYQQKGERGEFLVKLFYDKELDLCNWRGGPKIPDESFIS